MNYNYSKNLRGQTFVYIIKLLSLMFSYGIHVQLSAVRIQELL